MICERQEYDNAYYNSRSDIDYTPPVRCLVGDEILFDDDVECSYCLSN